jgi:hypothetical protein
VKKNNLIIVSAKENKLKNYDERRAENIYSNLEKTPQTSGGKIQWNFFDERSNLNRAKNMMMMNAKSPDCDHKNTSSYFT